MIIFSQTAEIFRIEKDKYVANHGPGGGCEWKRVFVGWLVCVCVHGVVVVVTGEVMCGVAGAVYVLVFV